MATIAGLKKETRSRNDCVKADMQRCGGIGVPQDKDFEKAPATLEEGLLSKSLVLSEANAGA